MYTQEQLKPLTRTACTRLCPSPRAQAIANRITARYRNDGYILSQAVVPRQDLRDGTLHIRVVEGFVNRVTVEGDGKDADSRGLVERYGQKITQDRPLKMKTLEPTCC